MSSWISLVTIMAIINGLTFVSVSRTNKYDEHCNDLECPKYTVLNKTDEYELRHYPSYKWAAAVQTGLDYSAANSANFKKLFRYIQGENVKNMKIEMTAPVLNHMTITPGSFSDANVTMHFFVPYKHQVDAPQPKSKNDKVFLVQRPMTVYVGSFGGHASKSDVSEAAKKLATALKKNGELFVVDQLIYAGYDAPWKVLGRHNEVMLLKTCFKKFQPCLIF